jgi:signal transduction histidine kinase/ActR/RegA family two-component response regulator
MSADVPNVPRRGAEGRDLNAGGAERAAGVAAVYSVENESKWAARLVCAGSLLTLVFQIAYLALDRRFLSSHQPWLLLLHLLNIGLFLIAAIMTLNVGPWLRHYWKHVAFSFSAIMIVSSTCISVITDSIQPLCIMLMLFLAGTGPFLSWGERTQALLSFVAIISFAAAAKILPDQRTDTYQWLGILIAAAIGVFSTALERRLRRARRRAEEEALNGRETLMGQERVRLAGQLTSGIVHDLNNILNVMKLRLIPLMHDQEVVEKHPISLQSIERAIDDAALTVARVRELGSVREESAADSIQLCEVIAQAVDLARTTIEAKSSLDGVPIRIESRVSQALPKVRGLASELRQVFLNLLLNASEAMDQRGEIKIDSAIDEKSVLIRFSDSGPGIPAEHLQHVFDPFFTTKGTKGTGLGLSIAKSIMESLGGAIRVSNGPSGGAVFTLEFPFAAASESSHPAAAPERIDGGCRVLLIDDDLDNLDALKEALVLSGHSVEVARSGEEGLERIRTVPNYDLVLCDLAMPGMNGWEVARVALNADPKLHFYIMTGWGRQAQKQIPPNLAIKGLLPKPIDLLEFQRILSSSIGRVDRAGSRPSRGVEQAIRG